MTRDEARQALVEPARRAGRPFEPDAAELMLDHIGGYPFAVQIYGREAWRSSQGAAAIDRGAVQRALPAAARRLDRIVRGPTKDQPLPAVVRCRERRQDAAPT